MSMYRSEVLLFDFRSGPTVRQISAFYKIGSGRNTDRTKHQVTVVTGCHRVSSNVARKNVTNVTTDPTPGSVVTVLACRCSGRMAICVTDVGLALLFI